MAFDASNATVNAWRRQNGRVGVRNHVVILPVGEAGTSPARLASAPGWRELRAVREGRVVSVDHDLFHHPGPGLTAAAVRLAAVLHPENEGAVR